MDKIESKQELQSLDPRVNRLPITDVPASIVQDTTDQLATFQVFVQPSAGKPFQHEGIVHAPHIDMAFILAKETFTRRFTCVSLCVASTADIYSSVTTEADHNVYDHVPEEPPQSDAQLVSFEIFQLHKRGKQHLHAGQVQASSPIHALHLAAVSFRTEKVIYNVWAIRTIHIRFTSDEEQDLWTTLPDKKFRDAANYKGGDKLKNFLERNS